MSKNMLRTPQNSSGSSSSSSSVDQAMDVINTPINQEPDEDTFLVTNTDGKSRHTRFEDEEISSSSRETIPFSLTAESLRSIIKSAISDAKNDWMRAPETGVPDEENIESRFRDVDQANVESAPAAPRPQPTLQTYDQNPASIQLQNTARVPESMYLKITQLSIDLARGLSIGCDDKNPREKMHQLRMAMQASGILSLIDGSRLEPVCTADNLNGFTPAIVKSIEINNIKRNVIIQQDDCFKYYSEKMLTIPFMLQMINKNMIHNIKAEIESESPILIYNALLNYFEGHKHHHIEEARVTLESHLFNSSYFTKDIHDLIIKINILEASQEMSLSEQYKMGILRKLIGNESRVNIKNSFLTAQGMKLNFSDTLEYLLRLWDAIPEANPVGMAAAGSTVPPLRFCYKFQKGECKRDKCQFIHRIMTQQEQIDRKSTRLNSSHRR